MEVGEELEELRRRFFNEYRPQIESAKFAVEDVRRIRKDELWLTQFLRRFDGDVDVTLPALVECLKWRQEFGVYNLSLLRLKPYLEKQVMYLRGVNVENKNLLWFNVRHHKKDDAEKDSQAFIVYWLERQRTERPDQQIVIIFDMSQTGLQNMDLDLIKFLLHCLKYYYPGILSYLLVYDIPWILSAAWKLVKSWLDPVAQKKIIFCNQGGLSEYISQENLPPHMGGQDDYRFTLDELIDINSPFRDPTELSTAEQETTSDYSSMDSPLNDHNQQNSSAVSKLDLDNFKKKSVKFADEGNRERVGNGVKRETVDNHDFPSILATTEPHRRRKDFTPSSPTTSASSGSSPLVTPREEVESPLVSALVHRTLAGPSSTGKPQTLAQRMKDVVEWRTKNINQGHSGPLLIINPKDELGLQAVPGEQDRVDAIILQNKGRKFVAFKIKITSPEKFRVRPSIGLVKPGNHSVVKVYLQSGYDQTVYKDKFLIQSVEIDETFDSDPTSDQLSDLWKTAIHENIVEHRLRCRVDETASVAQQMFREVSLERSPSIEIHEKKGEEVSRVVAQLRNENHVIKVLLLIALSLLVVVFVHQRIVLGSISSQLNNIQGNCYREP